MKALTFISKLSFITIFFLMSSINGFAQGWEIVYDSISTMGRQVSLTNDSCYIVTGAGSPVSSGISLKIDQQGKILWLAPFGGYSIQPTYDQGYIIAGGDNYISAILKKLDKNGNYVWSNTYGGASQDDFQSVIQSSDSGFVACGYSGSYGDSSIYVVKTDAFGNFLWKRSFYSADFGLARDLLEFDNHYYIAGYYDDFSNNPYLFVAKLNSEGMTIWRKDYQTRAAGFSIAITNDSCLIVAGRNFLTKLNLNGDTLWSRNYDPYWHLYSIDKTTDNGFIISGDVGIGLGSDNLLVKSDSAGNILWHRTYPTGCFESVITATNKSYIMCGYSWYNSIPKLRIIKIDSNGTAGQLDSNFENKLINIYPNPSKGKFSIVTDEIGKIQIIDLQGKEVYIGNEKEIDLSQKAKGIYIIKITTNKQTLTRKLIKQ